ncbi:unnamed protein product [Symbiodinium microadriaticum]|nr:unnamed protein product [Symbiodinium microadriaticum]
MVVLRQMETPTLTIVMLMLLEASQTATLKRQTCATGTLSGWISPRKWASLWWSIGRRWPAPSWLELWSTWTWAGSMSSQAPCDLADESGVLWVRCGYSDATGSPDGGMATVNGKTRPSVLQSYFYLYVCMLIHGALQLGPVGGQMYLCDFGANLNACTVDPNAEGAWQTRSFVAASLKALFPDKADDIRYYVPSTDEPWYELGEEEEDEAQESMEKWLGQVTVQVAGMSRLWKIVNAFVSAFDRLVQSDVLNIASNEVILVLVPKFLLWEMTASHELSLESTGVDFLMETAGRCLGKPSIDDLIVNSVALGFLLTLDEMLTEAMMPHQALGLSVVPVFSHFALALRLYSNVDVEAHTDDEVLLGDEHFLVAAMLLECWLSRWLALNGRYAMRQLLVLSKLRMMKLLMMVGLIVLTMTADNDDCDSYR